MVYDCTAGIPRLIQKTFETLCRFQREPIHLKTRTEIEDVLEECFVPVCTHIQAVRFDRKGESFEIYLTFMVIALLKPVSYTHLTLPTKRIV